MAIEDYSYAKSEKFKEMSKFFETEYPLNKHGLEELYALVETKIIPKGTRILEVYNSENQLRFLNRGVVREYYASKEKETNINFYTRPQFISDLSAFNSGEPTKKNQESITEIELFLIDKAQHLELLSRYQCGVEFIKLSFQKLLKNKELLEYNRLTKTPDELYQELLIYKPEWLQLIPQYHIASYLNITPETLSRIRKRIS